MSRAKHNDWSTLATAPSLAAAHESSRALFTGSSKFQFVEATEENGLLHRYCCICYDIMAQSDLVLPYFLGAGIFLTCQDCVLNAVFPDRQSGPTPDQVEDVVATMEQILATC